jgi:cytochrome c-type biogenesis protein CcmH
MAVYRDQLVEIDRDLKAGLIGAADATAARIEVSRRLLSASNVSDSPHQTQFARKGIRIRRLSVLAISLALLPIFAGGMYLRLGSPDYASAEKIIDQPAASADDAKVSALIAEVEGYLHANPNDGSGWETLAPIYMHLGQYEAAARAWRNTIAHLGDSADREESLGEALFAAANGVVTDEARSAFNKALSIDHDSVDARFYLGLAAKQDGRPDEAARIWRELIATAPPDADWTDTVRDALAQLEQPSMAAADGGTSKRQQAAMIKSMVEGLSERLKADGSDPDGWLRLARSYNVLGERDKAQTAQADARRALASDPDKLARFEQGMKSINRPIQSAPQEVARQPASPDAVPPEHDTTMQAMVDKLAQRLRTTGGDPDNWMMLVRSYETLGEHGKAVAATAQARQAFASDPEKLSSFNQLLVEGGGSLDTSPTASAPAKQENPKPTTADAAPAEQQMAMIKGMVDRLSERLKQNGHDVDGWIRLMRSYIVLGQRDKALAAGQNARIALGNDVEALRRLNAGAKELGFDLP